MHIWVPRMVVYRVRKGVTMLSTIVIWNQLIYKQMQMQIKPVQPIQ